MTTKAPRRCRVCALAITQGIAALIGPAALAQEACTTYTVKDGDTLGAIAQTAYGSFDYQNIFNAIRDALGANPNSVEPGTLLKLPCRDGRISADAEFGAVIAEQEAIASDKANNSEYHPPIRLVTANDWAPFTDEGMKGNGMLVRLTTSALKRGGNDRDYTIDFIDDWNARLDTLLLSGSFDVSIAWDIPNCQIVDTMSDFAKTRCREFTPTVPIYEMVYGYYTLPDSAYAKVSRLEDLAGARICRMDAWPTWDLAEAGLTEPLITLIRPPLPKDCMEAVLNGEADITGMETESAFGAIRELEAGMKLVQNPKLSHIMSLHFTSHKPNPQSPLVTAILNKGITEIRQSGEWYDIVSSALAEFNGLLPNG